MKPYKKPRPRLHLPSDHDYWVELRPLGLFDAQRIDRELMGKVPIRLKGNQDAADGGLVTTYATIDVLAAAQEVIRLTLVGWNLTEELGPPSLEAFGELKPEDQEFVLHTAVAGTRLEQSLGRASVRAVDPEAAAAADAAAEEEAELFTPTPFSPSGAAAPAPRY